MCARFSVKSFCKLTTAPLRYLNRPQARDRQGSATHPRRAAPGIPQPQVRGGGARGSLRAGDPAPRRSACHGCARVRRRRGVAGPLSHEATHAQGGARKAAPRVPRGGEAVAHARTEKNSDAPSRMRERRPGAAAGMAREGAGGAKDRARVRTRLFQFFAPLNEISLCEALFGHRGRFYFHGRTNRALPNVRANLKQTFTVCIRETP